MYITHNNQTYANVRVYSTSGSVRFTGDSLSGVTTLTGPVVVFADNGFELRTFVPIDYLRQDIKDGSWLLTNIPLPEPQPVVVTPAEYDLFPRQTPCACSWRASSPQRRMKSLCVRRSMMNGCQANTLPETFSL